MATIYLGLGTNLGDKADNLQRAAEEINRTIGKVTSLSSFYETAPWRFRSDNTFLNAALCLESTLTPEEVLARTQQIERDLGRTHKSANGLYSDRPIDIDILLYDDLRLSTPTLTLPHPGLTDRLFVLLPMTEIAPDLIHPVSGLSIRELLRRASQGEGEAGIGTKDL